MMTTIIWFAKLDICLHKVIVVVLDKDSVLNPTQSMMFMMWYAAQQRQQLKKIENASNNGISIADNNDDRYTMQLQRWW